LRRFLMTEPMFTSFVGSDRTAVLSRTAET
jgi:hypothetical protein